MSYNEFKARALYDFVAEGPNELSFRAHEILTITSSNAGNGWWYAKNSSGKLGVVPENYVQALVDPPEPNEPPPPPVSYPFSNRNYPSYDSNSSSNNNSRASYQSNSDQHQYMNPATLANWSAPELPSWTPVERSTSNQSKRRDSDSDDSFTDPEDNSPPRAGQSWSNTPSNRSTVNAKPPLTNNSTISATSRPSISGAEGSKSSAKPRLFDKFGLDNYLLNGSKVKPEKSVDITYDDDRGVIWLPNPATPPFSCTVEDPSKGTKLGGLKAYMEYKIHPKIPGNPVVGRRYKQFDWLHEQLVNKFRFICIPPLPGKQIAGRFDQDFVEERRRLLELWLNRICRHPVLCASFPVQHFITCEVTDKDRKQWKKGKRQTEKDELKEAAWLQCVTVQKTGLTDQKMQAQIDDFVAQQPGLESNLKNLSQNIAKYLERYTDVYDRDIQRISEVFSKVHQTLQVDTVTAGNRELSNSVSKISVCYASIGELYKTKASDGLRDFHERLQEYIGLVGCFPSIFSIQKNASELIRSIQQRGLAAGADFSSAIHRNYVLNHVVLAEINFFQQEKVTDLSQYMKTFVDEQIQFYEKVTNELRDASRSFK